MLKKQKTVNRITSDGGIQAWIDFICLRITYYGKQVVKTLIWSCLFTKMLKMWLISNLQFKS